MKKFYAPEIDGYIRFYGDQSLNPDKYDSKVKDMINELFEELDKIKSISKDDEIKVIYFSVPRGSIKHYGDYDELKQYGDVSNYEEFERNFKQDYPNDTYWYRMVSSKYESYRAISVNYKTIIYSDMNMQKSFEDSDLQEFLTFLIFKVKEIIQMLENNTYNDYVNNNLAYINRFGVIKRSDYWSIYPKSKENLLENISIKQINEFIKLGKEKTNDRIENMTANIYYKSVRLALEYNGYDVKGLTGKEVYLKYADGRDEGLRDIDPDSVEEFSNWYFDKNRAGGHPYEIIRGHSYARVNLYIAHDDKGFYLSLDGTRILRGVEIAKMYLSLIKNNIPIEIYKINIIKDALNGEDYLGIVPDCMLPIYCSGCFNKYKPLEFIHYDEKLKEFIKWEDVEKVFFKESVICA